MKGRHEDPPLVVALMHAGTKVGQHDCLSVWRDLTARDGTVQVHVQKIRFRDVGQVGKGDLVVDPRTGRVTEDGAWIYPGEAQRQQAKATTQRTSRQGG